MSHVKYLMKLKLNEMKLNLNVIIFIKIYDILGLQLHINKDIVRNFMFQKNNVKKVDTVFGPVTFVLTDRIDSKNLQLSSKGA